MTTANIIAATVALIVLILARDLWIFQRKYYSQLVRKRKPIPNREQSRAADRLARKAERTRRRVAQRRARK